MNTRKEDVADALNEAAIEERIAPLEGAVSTYRVAWLIDIEAESPREAASKARRIQLNPKSIATVFDVQAIHGSVVRIDLDTNETCD